MKIHEHLHCKIGPKEPKSAQKYCFSVFSHLETLERGHWNPLFFLHSVNITSSYLPKKNWINISKKWLRYDRLKYCKKNYAKIAILSIFFKRFFYLWSQHPRIAGGDTSWCEKKIYDPGWVSGAQDFPQMPKNSAPKAKKIIFLFIARWKNPHNFFYGSS